MVDCEQEKREKFETKVSWIINPLFSPPSIIIWLRLLFQNLLSELNEQLSQQADYCSSLGAASCTLLWRVSQREDCIHSILSGVSHPHDMSHAHLTKKLQQFCSDVNVNIICFLWVKDFNFFVLLFFSLKWMSFSSWSPAHCRATTPPTLMDYQGRLVKRLSLSSHCVESSQVSNCPIIVALLISNSSSIYRTLKWTPDPCNYDFFFLYRYWCISIWKGLFID